MTIDRAGFSCQAVYGILKSVYFPTERWMAGFLKNIWESLHNMNSIYTFLLLKEGYLIILVKELEDVRLSILNATILSNKFFVVFSCQANPNF